MKLNKILSSILVLLSPAVCMANAKILREPVDKGVYEMVYDNYNHKLLATSTGDKSQSGGYVYLLDPDNLHVSGKIPTANKPFGAAINNQTHIAWFTNSMDGSVTAVDLKDKKMIATIQLTPKKEHVKPKHSENTSAHNPMQRNDDNRPPAPREVRVDEKNNLVYVGGVNRKDSVIWIIDGKTYKKIGTTDGYGKLNTGLAVSSDGTKLYSSNGDGYFITTDLKSRKIISKKVITGDGQEHLLMNIAIDESHQRAFVSDNKTKNVYVVNLLTGELVDKIVSSESIGILYQPKNNELYLAHRNSGSVSVIDLNHNKVEKEFALPSHPNSLASNDAGDTVYVSVKQDSSRDHPTDLPDDVAMIK